MICMNVQQCDRAAFPFSWRWRRSKKACVKTLNELRSNGMSVAPCEAKAKRGERMSQNAKPAKRATYVG